jgi:hypothetical protein
LPGQRRQTQYLPGDTPGSLRDHRVQWRRRIA